MGTCMQELGRGGGRAGVMIVCAWAGVIVECGRAAVIVRCMNTPGQARWLYAIQRRVDGLA